MSEYSVNKFHPDALHVHWTLLRSCQYNCVYCPDKGRDDNFVLDHGRIMNMARRILETPRPFYDITLSGGDPCLHPFLPELIRFFSTYRPNIHIDLTCNGSMDISWFQTLISGLPKNVLTLNLYVHPARADLGHILFLIGIMVENGQKVSVYLVEDAQSGRKYIDFHTAFLKFSKSLPFEIYTVFPKEGGWENKPVTCGQSNNVKLSPARTQEYERLFFLDEQDSAETDLPEISSFPVDTEETGRGLWIKEPKHRFCCVGVNISRIDPQGNFYGSMCNIHPGPLRLWEAPPGILQTFARPILCPHSSCPAGLNDFNPKFVRREEACDWLEKREERARLWPQVAGVFLERGSLRCDCGQEIYARLRRSAKSSVSWPNTWLAQRIDDVTRVYTALADAESRTLFIEAIKSCMSGKAFNHCEITEMESQAEWVPNERDTPWTAKESYFSFMDISGDDALEVINARRGPIRLRRPKIRFHVHPNEEVIDIPLSLLDIDSVYNLTLRYEDDNKLSFTAIHPHCQLPCYSIQSDDPPAVSLVMVSGEDEKAALRTILSILTQNVRDFEIIVITRKPAKNMAQIFAYAEKLAGKLRIFNSGSAMTEGEMLDTALRMASGQYVCFVEPGQILPSSFLAKSLAIAENEGADITVWGVNPNDESIILEKEDSLRAFLTGKAGGLVKSLKLFRRAAIALWNVRFAGFPNGMDLQFTAPAFLFSGKTAFVPVSDGVQADNPSPIFHDNAIEACGTSIQFLEKFVQEWTDRVPASTLSDAMDIILEQRLDQILRETEDHIQLGHGEAISPESLARISSSHPALCRLIEVAVRNTSDIGLPVIDPDHRDWRQIKTRSLCNFIPYGNAELPGSRKPLLSVIVPNYNKAPWLEACMASILGQSMPDFELIVIDDASTDESWEILTALADAHPRIRLFRSPCNQMQGACRNFAMEKARGEYLLFVDSDDIIRTGFFEEGLKVARYHGADMTIFSYEQIDQNGNVTYRQILDDKDLTGTQALQSYLAAEFNPSCWGKIYSTSFAQTSGCLNDVGVFQQDHIFVSGLAARARKVHTSPFLACSIILSKNSSLRPAARQYLHIHSGCRLFMWLDRLAKHDFQTALSLMKHASWNLENIYLPTWRAYLYFSGEVALTEEDYALLRGNYVFMLALLMFLAKRLKKSSPAPRRLPSASSSPLVSVIVPVFNQEACIAGCLDSILAQSLGELEVIVVDDASTDRTLAVCERYASKDPRVRVLVSQKNNGQGEARNLGIREARAPYLAFVDSDDSILEDFLLRGVAALELEPNADLAHFTEKMWPGPGLKFIEGSEMLRLFCIGQSDSLAVWGKIYRTSFIRSNELQFPPHFFEDSLFLMRAFHKARGVLLARGKVYNYTVTPHPASTMNPVKYTPRHVAGHFGLIGATSRFFLANPDIPRATALSRIRNRFYYVRDCPLALYLTSFTDARDAPLGTFELENLRDSPETIALMLNDLALGEPRPQAVLCSDAIEPIPNMRLILDEETVPAGDEVFLSLVLRGDSPTALAALESLLAGPQPGLEVLLVINNCENGELYEKFEKISADNSFLRILRSRVSMPGRQPEYKAISFARGKWIALWDRNWFILPGFSQMMREKLECFVGEAVFFTPSGSENSCLDALSSYEACRELLLANERSLSVFKSEFLRSLPFAGCGSLSFMAQACAAASSARMEFPAFYKNNAGDWAPQAQAGFWDFLADLSAIPEIAAKYLSNAEAENLLRDWHGTLLKQDGPFLNAVLSHVRARLSRDKDWLMPAWQVAQLSANDDLLRRLTLEWARARARGDKAAPEGGK